MLSVIISALLAVVLILIAYTLYRVHKSLQGKARRAGHETIGDYLQATPRTDDEKREAVDMALKGLVICLVGLVLPPLLLIGIFPLFYGARKMAYAQMGFGLFEDHPHQ